MSAGLVLKLLIGGVAGATAITPVAFYYAPPWSIALTQDKLNEFKRSYGFDSCQTFLSNSDNKRLLFLCLKTVSGTSASDNKTVHHYLYNGGSWEEAISLEKDSGNKSKDFFLVRTRTWLGERRRVINSLGGVEPGNLTEHDKWGMRCNFESSVKRKTKKAEESKHFVCSGKRQGESAERKLKWTLKDFTQTHTK